MPTKPSPTRVILVRHGESSFNLERRVQGHWDKSTLTETGKISARQVGDALSEMKFDAVYSSPLSRAKDTADIILSRLKTPPASPIQVTDSLKEINLVLWEGMLFTEVAAQYPEEYRNWQEAPDRVRMVIPGDDGQPIDFYPVLALFEQARDFWKELLPRHAGQTILLVAHSGINRALVSTAVGLPPDRYQSIHQSNCGISVLNFSGSWDDPVQLESLNLTAHLGEPLPPMKQGRTGHRLLLVRHGETNWNRDKRFQGQIDVPLNEMGRVQSGQAAEFLKPVPIRYAVTSPMLRPKETAEIILQHHPDVDLELEDNLREISHGLWEGKLETEIEQEYPGMLEQWQNAPETVQMPEGENLHQVWERAIAAWDGIVQSAYQRQEPGITLVVAHDAINKAILCYVLGLGPNYFWSFKQGNGAVSVIDYSQGSEKPVLTAMNITSHLGGVLDKTAAGAL
ncbi:histidine phosphatase family protein [Leptothermofonsia sichuanensis E412]|uniref:histidine phosphatase family protein n=1 Tax=Leptothermofonsia sichuanensis TaxID=2917832 RepID=UPI001CA6C221|nr:histidine phosphatase family protein [Leptothermofonsia sichuanensis]QZZ20326.1 histidine phosphatase family protein [Leptothermofonsia sichuanensis E412]